MGPCLEEGRGSCGYLANIQKQPLHSNDDRTYLELEWFCCFIMCENIYLTEPSTCNTPVESNIHTIHMSYLTFMR